MRKRFIKNYLYDIKRNPEYVLKTESNALNCEVRDSLYSFFQMEIQWGRGEGLFPVKYRSSLFSFSLYMDCSSWKVIRINLYVYNFLKLASRKKFPFFDTAGLSGFFSEWRQVDVFRYRQWQSFSI